MGLLARVLDRGAGPTAHPRGDVRDPLHASGLALDELRATWACASWLIGYPGPELLAQLPTIRAVARSVPGRAGVALGEAVAALAGNDLIELQEAYVDTFDTRRRGCLYLTYFSQGDTRRRGMALVRIKQDFRRAGVELGDDELPDHLGVVLEFAAGHDAEAGAKILRQNRAGVELLRLHLEEIDSPWNGVLRAVCATLPPLDADDREAVLRLAAEGPEEELVGLDGYGAEPGTAPSALPGGGCSGHDGPGAPAARPGPVDIEIMRGRAR